MRNILKLFLSSIILGLTALTLASCGIDRSKSVVFWHTYGKENQIILEQAIKEFEKENPGIKVYHEQKGNYDKLKEENQAALAAGTQPNITVAYPDHVALYNRRRANILNLDTFINDPELGFTKEELADFVPLFLEEGRQFEFKGTYTLPYAKSTEVLFYNKDMLESAKITQVPRTWEELADAAKVLKAIKPEVFPIGYDSPDNLFISTVTQRNVPYTEFREVNSKIQGVELFNDSKTNEELKKAALFYKRLYDQKLLVTKAELAGAYTSTNFIESKLFFSVGSTGGAKYNDPEKQLKDKSRKFNVGVAPAPQWDINNPKQIMQGPNLAIFDRNEVENKNAFKFLKFFLQPKYMAKWAINTGYQPARSSAYETAEYKAFVNKKNKNSVERLFFDILELSKTLNQYYYTTIPYSRSAKARNEVGKTFHSLFTEVDTKLDDNGIMTEYQRILDRTYQQIQL